MTERPTPPRLALTQEEAAAALGVSVETFTRHIRPTLPSVPAGSRRLYLAADAARRGATG